MRVMGRGQDARATHERAFCPGGRQGRRTPYRAAEDEASRNRELVSSRLKHKSVPLYLKTFEVD
jgi:hypothetical protein